MNPRRRRRLRKQRKERAKIHLAVWKAVHLAERSRIAQAHKRARDLEKKLGPGVQVIPAHVFGVKS